MSWLRSAPVRAAIRLRSVLCLGLILLTVPGCGFFPAPNNDLSTVLRVIAGDTIEVQDPRLGKGKVRYIGVDTPETFEQPGCYGKEAKERNQELVAGKQVRLQKDRSDKDRFGRWLRYVYVGDTFVNGELVREGYAAAVAYPPDTAQQANLEALEREARSERRGVWGPACANAPNRLPRFR